MNLTVGSLFAGIGGFDLGLERAGMVVRWQVEIDPYASAVLAKHWPDVTRYGDICAVRGADVEPVDVLCGGFPCQDISLAGKGAGITGARSGLWSEFDRLIGELRPRYVIVENVSALLVRGIERVLGDLAARRYDAEWDCIPASAIGANHQRDRLWLVAYPTQLHSDGGKLHREHREGQVSEFRDGGGYAPMADSNTPRQSLVFGREAISQLARQRAASSADWRRVEPDVGRVAHGVSNRVDRLKGLGNAIVPQIAEWIGRRIVEAEA